MSEIDRALCRKAAAECIDLARAMTDAETKQVLLTRAQEWLKLAYSEHEAEFDRLLTEFNTRQMNF
jgi:predicted RNase H-like HicB family nuclease